MRTRGAAGVAIAVLAAAAVAVAAGPGPGPGADNDARPAKARPAVSVSGDVSGLYPGATKRVRLRLRNLSPRSRTVTAVRARAAGAGPGCSARNLTMGDRRVRLRIPARSQRRLRFRIGMIGDAADGCQGARFPIRYRARAR